MPTTEEALVLKNAMIDNYNHYAEGLDSKNWPMVRACFADEVLIDYGPISAESGSPDVPRKTEDWMNHLQGVINGFDVTRHMITNHRFTVTDDQISCRAYLMADHVIFPAPEMPIAGPDDVVTVVGEYHNHYREIEGVWKICKSELVVHYSTGNMNLFAVSAERVAAQTS